MIHESGGKPGMRGAGVLMPSRPQLLEEEQPRTLVEELVKKLFGILNWN